MYNDEGHIHAGAYPGGGILGAPALSKSNLWKLRDLLDSTKQLFEEIYVSICRIRYSMCLNRIPSYLIENVVHNILILTFIWNFDLKFERCCYLPFSQYFSNLFWWKT